MRPMTRNRFRGNVDWTFRRDARTQANQSPRYFVLAHVREPMLKAELERWRPKFRVMYVPTLLGLFAGKKRGEGWPPVVVGLPLRPRWPFETTWAWPPVLQTNATGRAPTPGETSQTR